MTKDPFENAEITTIEPSPQKRAKGTIGIIGYNKFAVAKMNEKLVEQANAMGLEQDQSIPDIIAIAFDIAQVSDLKDAAAICDDYGCDIILVMRSTESSAANISSILTNESIKISTDFRQPTSQKQSLDELDRLDNELAKSAIEYAISLKEGAKKARRPNLVYGEVSDEEVAKNLEQDLRDRKARIGRRMAGGGYTILSANNNNYIYVLGGAGPKASAAQVTHLIEKGLNCIHSSVNCAPGKHHFEMTGQQPYLTHYKHDLTFLQALGQPIKENYAKRGTKSRVGAIVIPCNTAHRSIPKFCPQELIPKIVDIRDFLKNEKKICSKFILLGTNTTIGVDIGDRTGTYQMFCDTHGLSNEITFITPKGNDQDDIMAAIFEIKAGKLSQAHDKILSVVKKLQDGESSVILGCTELALAFDSAELKEKGFIDPASHLASNAQEFILNSRTQKAINKAAHKTLVHPSDSPSSDSSSEELQSPIDSVPKTFALDHSAKPSNTSASERTKPSPAKIRSPIANRLTPHTKQTTL